MIEMVRKKAFISVLLIGVFLLGMIAAAAQPQTEPKAKSQEVSDEGIPVLIKHLPDWENTRNGATFANNPQDLKNALGSQPVLDLIDFSAGTEAVTAVYPVGKLLIVEFTSPQSSSDADAKFQQHLAGTPQTPSVVYRRIGNNNTFVFDATNETAANSLLDEVKYQKTVQWLGEDPYLLKKLERYFVNTTRDIFISTVLWIASGLGLSIFLGIITGFVFFRFREQKRATRTAYSDAGGLTRLNLDGLSE